MSFKSVQAKIEKKEGVSKEIRRRNPRQLFSQRKQESQSQESQPQES